MSVVYGQLAAKQAAARIMATSGKRKHEYDSDEDTEGGKIVIFYLLFTKIKCIKFLLYFLPFVWRL